VGQQPLKKTTIKHGPKATDLVFVRAYHNLPGISQGEWVNYYNPASIDRLRQDLKSYIQHQLKLFTISADYGEYFSVAEYDSLWDSLAEHEVSVFRLALQPEDRNTLVEELHPLDGLNGFRAVMLHRINEGDLDDIRSALSLFDDMIECAVEAVDERNPRSYISLETAAQFAASFIDGLLECIECLKQPFRLDSYQQFVGETFAPLKPLLDGLRPAVHREGWPRDDLSLGRLLLIVDYFKQSIEERWNL
jgi:hypothetical protein